MLNICWLLAVITLQEPCVGVTRPGFAILSLEGGTKDCVHRAHRQRNNTEKLRRNMNCTNLHTQMHIGTQQLNIQMHMRTKNT